MRLKTAYFLIVLLAMVAEAKAQHGQVMYYMNLPQNHLLNPARRPSNAVYIGLPVLSGIKAGTGNNFFDLSDIIANDPLTDSLITILHPDYNIDDFLSTLSQQNYLEVSAAVQTLGVGFNIGKDGYMFIDINERAEGNLTIPGDLFTLIFKGNESFAGSTIDLSSLGGRMQYFREAGIGFSTPLSNKLRVGFKGKMLFGVASVSVDNNALAISVGENYTHSFEADVAVNISAPVTISEDADKNITGIEIDDSQLQSTSQKINYFTGLRNLGMGLDIGAVYDITDRISLSASVIDLGYIKWKDYVNNINVQGEFSFDGIDITDVVNGDKTIDELGQEMLDSLQNSVEITHTTDPFTTWLSPGVTFGASYTLNKTFSLGLLSYTKFVNSNVREALTFSGNINLGTAISAGISYTISSGRYDNLGIGLAARAGIFQLYAIADRIPLAINNIDTGGGTVPMPGNLNIVNFRVGLNLLFGNKIRQREDKPMLEVL
jgi:hypothetical protein